MAPTKFMKQKWYPRPHLLRQSWRHGLETGVNNEATIYPICHYDEGLGAPSGYNANPTHASFVRAAGGNCYPESRVNNIITQLQFALTKGALETDKIHALRFAVMPIYIAFKEKYEALDEVSALEIQDVLELQTETTDRQGYPLYNGVKMAEQYTNSGLLATTQPGLTTTQVIEGVTFQPDKYYNMLQFYTNGDLLKTVSGGLKWFTLTRSRPTKTLKFRMNSKTKRMNPYTFYGILVYVPKVDSDHQLPISSETTNIDHVAVLANARYQEWNGSFNMEYA